MDTNLKLYMVLLGCTPTGRLTEQHDIFFGIATSLKEMKADMYAFWPDGGQLHIDSWREVTHVDGHKITVIPKAEAEPSAKKLFFLNLGGYKPNDLEEYHYKLLAVGEKMSVAIKKSKQTAFYKHYGFKGAESHVDEKYGLDVDDMHKVDDVLAWHLREQYHIHITPDENGIEDELHIGYVKLGPIVR
ncbi:MAG: DUF1543 domain-containing protein [Flavobacterium sp.]